MVSCIAFLVAWPISRWEAQRWGFDYLRSQGFRVEVYDLSRLLHRKALLHCPVPYPWEESWIHRFESYADFEETVRSGAGSTMIIDYIIGLSPVDLRTERVFRILKRTRASYCVISAGALPGISAPRSFRGALRQLAHDLTLAANPRTLLNFLAKKAIQPLTTLARLYPTPDLIFGGGAEALDRYRQSYGIPEERIVPIHSIDHDTYLGYLAGGGSVTQDGSCVFLDEAATHHPDFSQMGTGAVEEEEYFRAMNRFFDRLEEETGLSVVVAAHPRSAYEKMPGVFGGRRIVKGRSAELVAKSSLVVTHASTSVSFALLFEKPLLLVKTAGIARNGHYGMLVDTMARALKLTPLLLDGAEEPPRLPIPEFSPDRCRDYLYRYVKFPGVGELTVWEVVSREIARYRSAEALLRLPPDA